jgi:hypothetical protein
MITKKFLAPILVLAAVGLPIGASTVTYCDIGGCPNSNTAFAVATGSLSFANGGVFLAFPGSSTTAVYTDSLTGAGFDDLSTPDLFTISGGSLATSVNSRDTVHIVVPNGYTALELFVVLSAAATLTLDSQNYFVNPGANNSTLIEFTNVSTTGWTVDLGLFSNSGITVTGFDVAGPVVVADTPEVGTLLLIGFGLIAMRWMPRVPRTIFRTLRTV